VIVAHYFASDVHLKFDHPERDRRFAAFVSQLQQDDALWIAGDLCDFAMGARHSPDELLRCDSLQALARFRRAGGQLFIMVGNHDVWLAPFYAGRLGASMITEPFDLVSHGLRIRIVHGHRLGARRPWKAWLESRAFWTAFSRLPRPIANQLDLALTWRNERGFGADEERHLRVYREYAALCRGSADLVVVGHVHRAVDDAGTHPRLVVLGGWQHRGSFLRVDAAGARTGSADNCSAEAARQHQAEIRSSTCGA
jgi:UDP-2,3-diacylglucosamine hydrolase